MKMLRIKQVRSAINSLEGHKRTIRALGLRKMSQTVEHPDNPAMRGMVRLVTHLVTVEEFDA